MGFYSPITSRASIGESAMQIIFTPYQKDCWLKYWVNCVRYYDWRAKKDAGKDAGTVPLSRSSAMPVLRLDRRTVPASFPRLSFSLLPHCFIFSTVKNSSFTPVLTRTSLNWTSVFDPAPILDISIMVLNQAPPLTSTGLEANCTLATFLARS